jgi:hypothetical protein
MFNLKCLVEVITLEDYEEEEYEFTVCGIISRE